METGRSYLVRAIILMCNSVYFLWIYKNVGFSLYVKYISIFTAVDFVVLLQWKQIDPDEVISKVAKNFTVTF